MSLDEGLTALPSYACRISLMGKTRKSYPPGWRLKNENTTDRIRRLNLGEAEGESGGDSSCVVSAVGVGSSASGSHLSLFLAHRFRALFWQISYQA